MSPRSLRKLEMNPDAADSDDEFFSNLCGPCDLLERSLVRPPKAGNLTRIVAGMGTMTPDDDSSVFMKKLVITGDPARHAVVVEVLGFLGRQSGRLRHLNVFHVFNIAMSFPDLAKKLVDAAGFNDISLPPSTDLANLIDISATSGEYELTKYAVAKCIARPDILKDAACRCANSHNDRGVKIIDRCFKELGVEFDWFSDDALKNITNDMTLFRSTPVKFLVTKDPSRANELATRLFDSVTRYDNFSRAHEFVMLVGIVSPAEVVEICKTKRSYTSFNMTAANAIVKNFYVPDLGFSFFSNFEHIFAEYTGLSSSTSANEFHKLVNLIYDSGARDFEFIRQRFPEFVDNFSRASFRVLCWVKKMIPGDTRGYIYSWLMAFVRRGEYCAKDPGFLLVYWARRRKIPAELIKEILECLF